MAVPDTTTFTLQNVVDEINPTTDDLVDCISDADSGSYDLAYYTPPATSLLEFRNYGGAGLGYGYLYNKYAFTDANFATSGWHVPTQTEFTTLYTYLGGTGVAGGKLKETGTTHWTTPNTGATNSSGFYGFGSGHREGISAGTFAFLNISAWIASSTISSNLPVFMDMEYDDDDVGLLVNQANTGLSVRLVKDVTSLSNGETSTMTDYDGNTYDTICIGTQEWIAQNWKCTKLNTGTALTKITSGTTWVAAGTGDKYYCAYDNNEGNV